MRRLTLALGLLAAGCNGHPQPPAPAPHYVLGRPYQAGGVWFYPRESDQAEETGIAMVYGGGHAALTANGEAFDQIALAAAHPTLPLPSIARLTNLETGRQVLVRINDRGPATPHRVVAVTRRTAQLLGMPEDGVARVRLQMLPAESQAATESLPGAPHLAMEAAPLEAIAVSALPLLRRPAGGTAVGSDVASGEPRAVQGVPGIPVAPADSPPTPPLRLPERVWQGTPDPETLWVLLDTFQTHQYAVMQRATVAGLGAQIADSVAGGARTFRVRIGPLASVAQADAVLDQVIRAGVMDARIVVE